MLIMQELLIMQLSVSGRSCGEWAQVVLQSIQHPDYFGHLSIQGAIDLVSGVEIYSILPLGLFWQKALP